MDHIRVQQQQADWNNKGAFVFDRLHSNATDATKRAVVRAEMEQRLPTAVTRNAYVQRLMDHPCFGKIAVRVLDSVAERLTPAQKTQIIHDGISQWWLKGS